MSQPDMARRADTRYLRDVAYANPSGLAARASLYDFQRPYIDLQSETLELLAPLDGRVVGDIGCGNGRYIAALRGAGAHVIGVDLSVGMLTGVQSPPTLIAADAQSLPLTDASLDVVMMMHMLYHVPDPAMAVGEAARVLRSGGKLLVATNGRGHLSDAITSQIRRDGQFTIRPRSRSSPRPSRRFSRGDRPDRR
jgi:SAM-dependent methyltransferase